MNIFQRPKPKIRSSKSAGNFSLITLRSEDGSVVGNIAEFLAKHVSTKNVITNRNFEIV